MFSPVCSKDVWFCRKPKQIGRHTFLQVLESAYPWKKKGNKNTSIYRINPSHRHSINHLYLSNHPSIMSVYLKVFQILLLMTKNKPVSMFLRNKRHTILWRSYFRLLMRCNVLSCIYYLKQKHSSFSVPLRLLHFRAEA